MNNKKFFSLAILGGCILTSSAVLFPVIQGDYANKSLPTESGQNYVTQKNDGEISSPQYKDSNGVCGLAKNKNGEIVAVSSDGTCPNNDALFDSYGYKYISLTDSFRPQKQGDSCGTAFLVTQDIRIGSKDMAKLEAMLSGNLQEVSVSPSNGKCPTQPELSDNITNSIGVPVRFEYNKFNANPDSYPLLKTSESNYLTDVEIPAEKDRLITKTLSGTKEFSANGIPIPKILLTPESKELCEGDYVDKCIFDQKEMSLKNRTTGKIYLTYTNNGYVLPKFMITKGAWDACGGIFSQCDFIPDEETPSKRGTVVNNITKQSYTSREVSEIISKGDYADLSDG